VHEAASGEPVEGVVCRGAILVLPFIRRARRGCKELAKPEELTTFEFQVESMSPRMHTVPALPPTAFSVHSVPSADGVALCALQACMRTYVCRWATSVCTVRI
jgi:hypothetical protein